MCKEIYLEAMLMHNPDDPIEVAVKNNLKEGQTVNSFAELCRLCNVSLGHGGKQRQNAEAKISQYIDYSEMKQEGQRKKVCVINEIYDIPHIHSRRSGGKYRDRLLRALYYDLMKADNLDTEGDGLIITSYDELAEQLGFVNLNYKTLSNYHYKTRSSPPEILKEVSTIHPLLISEYLMACKSRYKTLLKGMLDDFLSKGMLESKEEKIQLVFTDNSRRWAEVWESDIITEVYSRYFPDGQALFLINDAERRRRYSALIKEINDAREEHYQELDEVDFGYIKYYHEKLLISFSKDKMNTAATRNEIVLIDSNLRKTEQVEISDLFCESMRQTFRRRYPQKIEAGKKMVEKKNKELAFGKVSDHLPLQQILDGYIDAMDMLLSLTVSRGTAI